MMVALMCVGALFVVCLFGLFQVLKHNSRSDAGKQISGSSQTHQQHVIYLKPHDLQATHANISHPIKKVTFTVMFC